MYLTPAVSVPGSLTGYRALRLVYQAALPDGIEGLLVMLLSLIHISPSQRYHLERYEAALDSPGEWFLREDGTLLYYPRDGETPETAEVIAPVAEGFLRIVGEPAVGLWVRDLRFEGLTFLHAECRLPEDGISDGQAAVSIGAVVEVDGAANVTLHDLSLIHI